MKKGIAVLLAVMLLMSMLPMVNGIQDVTKYINSGKLLIGSNCTNTLNEFEAYCWDESKDEDVVLKENDHAMDMIRYFVRTVLRNMWKWIV